MYESLHLLIFISISTWNTQNLESLKNIIHYTQYAISWIKLTRNEALFATENDGPGCKLKFIQRIVHEGTMCSNQYLSNLYCLTSEKFSSEVVESPSWASNSSMNSFWIGNCNTL